MSNAMAELQEATIKQHCKTLHMPMMASQFSPLAEQAVRENRTHVGYLEALLTAEIDLGNHPKAANGYHLKSGQRKV